MKRDLMLAVVVPVVVALTCAVSAVLAVSPEGVRQDGAFGFPQKSAQVLCDTSALRVSVWNNAKYLYIQAVHWDSAGAAGLDSAAVFFDVDADRQLTPKRDRVFYLNGGERNPGLWNNFALSSQGWSRLTDDSRGRGQSARQTLDGGSTIRVDCFCLTLLELGIRPGDDIRLMYWARLSGDGNVTNSAGHQLDAPHMITQIPMAKFHAVVIGHSNAPLALTEVPDGARRR